MRQADDKKAKVYKRGNDKGKLAGYFGKGMDNGKIADWLEADALAIQQAIAAAGYKGGALRFGYTSDGGAYAIAVYDGGDYHVEYVRPSEDVNATLRRIVDYFRES